MRKGQDLIGGDISELTQDFLAHVLGVRRTSVSLAANALQDAGLMHYSRGRLEITDLEGLRATACECYATVKSHNERLLGHELR
jgi:Mn-dependent DtxR family transcriptional regulator